MIQYLVGDLAARSHSRIVQTSGLHGFLLRLEYVILGLVEHPPDRDEIQDADRTLDFG